MTSQSTTAISNPTRRQIFLTSAAAGALVAIGLPSKTLAQSLNTDDFLALSQKLLRKDNLNEDIAEAMLDAFKARGNAEEIAALLNGAANQDLEDDIVASWYSGVSPDLNALDVLTYTDARMWDAMLFTKPMGYCGGGMGYWAEPPVS